MLFLNTAAKYLNRGTNLFIGFFLTPFLLRHLGPDSLALQVIAIQALQFCMLIGGACSKGYSRFATLHYARRDFDKMNQVLGRGLTITLFIVLITAGVIAVLVSFAGKALGIQADLLVTAQWVIIIIGAGYVFDQFSGVIEALLFVSQRFYVLEIAQILARISSVFALLVLFGLMKPSIVGWVSVSVGCAILFKLVYVIPSALKALPQARLRLELPSGPEFREMTHFTFASLVGTLGFLLYYASSSIVISHLPDLGTAKVVAYNLGQRWDPQVRELVIAFAVSLTPVFTSLYAVNDRSGLRSLFLRSCRHAILIGMLPSLLLFWFADPFITLWVGAAYAGESAPILRLSVLNVLISVPAIVSYEVLIGLGRLRGVAWITAAGGVLNILLAIVFDQVWGLGTLGVAISMLISYSGIACTCIVWWVIRELKISPGELFSQAIFRPLCASLPASVTAVGLQLYSQPSSWFAFFGQMALSGSVFLLATYVLALPAGDKRALQAVIKKVAFHSRYVFATSTDKPR